MKLKKILAVILSVLMLVSLCACGKMTAERLIADMAKALAEVDSFAGTMNMGMEMGISVMGESMDMSMTMDADVSYADKITYTKGTTTTAMAGQDDIVVEMEGYSVTDGDTITTYTLTEGTWTKMEMPKPEMETSLDTVKMLIDPENLGKIVLQEELDTYDGREVYVLTISDCNYPELATDYINSQMGSVFGDMDLSEIDMSGIVMQVTLKVYKDTKLPAVLSVDFGDSMTSFMDSAMDAMIGAFSEGMEGLEGVDIGAIFEQLNMSFEIPAAMTTVTFDEYNIEPVVVPKEALDAEELLSDGESIFDSILGAGLGDMTVDDPEDTDTSVPVTEPGQVVVFSDDGLYSIVLGEVPGYTLVADYTDDYTACYEFYTETSYSSYMYYIISLNGYTMEELVADSISGYIDYLNQFECENIVTSDVQTATVGGYDVAYVTFDYILDYPSQDILALIAVSENYVVAVESYTMTEAEIDTIATLETAVSAFVG
ncbi:MAG: hypothetical protein IJ017_01210 [Oscillospiraceae bacterium]|nr:hypothetical protein [Oscillospiraceae bacterium]